MQIRTDTFHYYEGPLNFLHTNRFSMFPEKPYSCRKDTQFDNHPTQSSGIMKYRVAFDLRYLSKGSVGI